MVHRLLLTYLFYVKIYLVFTKSREKIEDSKAFMTHSLNYWSYFFMKTKRIRIYLKSKKWIKYAIGYEAISLSNLQPFLFFSFLFFKQGYMKLILIMKKWWCLFRVWLQLFFKVFFVPKCIKWCFFYFFFKSMHQNNSKHIKKFKFFKKNKIFIKHGHVPNFRGEKLR
jgi:hypothetical protein